MTLYHCSPAPGLRVLRPSESRFGKPRQVCLAASVPMALMYGVRHFEYTYGYTKAGELYYEEFFPNALEEIYRGKRASLYVCAHQEDMETTEIPNEYTAEREVPVEREISIPDVYAALMEQTERGTLKIVRWEDASARRREWMVEAELRTIREQDLLARPDSPFARYVREKYPKSWALAAEALDGDVEERIVCNIEGGRP